MSNIPIHLPALRRSFHMHPETAWTEIWTSCEIARHLLNMGYEVLIGREVCKADARMGLPSDEALEEAYRWALEQGADPNLAEKMRGGFTGVIAILRCGEGPTTALRFDIDALPITESCELCHRPAAQGFRSVHEGRMHACGHDGHITMGLGVAAELMKTKAQRRGTIKLIFQPAEEGVRGAKSIVENGHLEGVDYVLAAHMSGDVNSQPGILIRSGKTLATAKFDAVFHGTPAHAGQAPQEGNNALLSAASAVLNLHAIPRRGDAMTQINVGTISGGSGRNVVCDWVRLEAEVRGENAEASAYMVDYAKRILESSAMLHGCTVDIKSMGEAGCTANTRLFSEALSKHWKSYGFKVEERFDEVWQVSEDFTFLAQKVQEQGGSSCYFHVLSPCPAGLHKAEFDFEENSLLTGISAFLEAIHWIEENR